jgi:phosphatidylinositol alpha 1,6-mannosyltransferase
VNVPRVAFFADSFHEVNGVARTSREFARFAQERQYPFFSVHTGPETRHITNGAFETFELRNSAAVLRLQGDLAFDLLFLRQRARLEAALLRFRPDLIHITGPSHCGILGAILGHNLGVPLVASWHTNLHEYAARRLKKLIRWLPAFAQNPTLRNAENASLALILQFYGLARLLFAPNPELVQLLESNLRRPCYPMQRGIDASLFSPDRRRRSDSGFVIGYVGRLSPEKNVRMLADLEQRLIAQGLSDYRFLIIGDGGERAWLAAHIQRCELPGVLLGEELAGAYAGMDAFVFPSATDTFGNVILESMASAVPIIVSAHGGPKFLVENAVTGFIAHDVADFARYVRRLHDDPALRTELGQNARRAASAFCWPAVFERVYQIYDEAIAAGVIVPSRSCSSAQTREKRTRVLPSVI